MRVLLFILCLIACTSVDVQSSSSLIVETLREKGVTFSHDNSVALLTGGQEKFDDLSLVIKQTKGSVHLEYFNFRNGSIARLLLDILEEKVAEGIEVRALFDASGNWSNNRPLMKRRLDLIHAKDAEIYKFDPITFPWINYVLNRDHRKIVVVDGEVAYTGGMNVTDYYIKGTRQVGKWHDMHCRIEGLAVNDLQRTFLRMRNKTAKQNVHSAKCYRGHRDRGYIKGLKSDTCSTSGDKMVGIVSHEPRISNEMIRAFYAGAIDAARNSLKIINPYFTLNRGIKKVLKKATKRGVKVEIMLSTSSDIPLTPDYGFYNTHKLMKQGANMWTFTDGFHRIKVIMADDKFCTVGSTNLNARSLNFDHEENAVIVDRCTTRQLDRLFDDDKKDSFLLTPKSWDGFRVPWQKLRGWFAHLLAPVL